MTDPLKRRGGARPGAGRPAGKPAKLDTPPTDDPLIFLKLVMNDGATDARLRISAAVALMPFIHAKVGELGKKDATQDAAKKAGAGRYASGKPPVRLVR